MGVVQTQLCYNSFKGISMETNYNRTHYGRIHNIYNSQRKSSRVRGMKEPNYTKAELYDWAVSQPIYFELFKKWEDNEYNRMFSPSVDRKDDNKPYTMGNIQLMSFRDNNIKSHEDRKSGKLITSQNRTVRQYTKEGKFVKEYYSIREAGREINTNPNHIGSACKEDRKSAGGFLWKYVDGGVL